MAQASERRKLNNTMNIHIENGLFYFGIDGKKLYGGRSNKPQTHREKYTNGFVATLIRIGFVLLLAWMVFGIILLSPNLFVFVILALLLLHLVLRALWRKGLTLNEDWALGMRTAFQKR